MSATTRDKLEFTHALYDCGICSCYHPWNWDADCRDDSNRYGSPEEYAAKYGISPNAVTVHSWDERMEADNAND